MCDILTAELCGKLNVCVIVVITLNHLARQSRIRRALRVLTRFGVVTKVKQTFHPINKGSRSLFELDISSK